MAITVQDYGTPVGTAIGTVVTQDTTLTGLVCQYVSAGNYFFFGCNSEQTQYRFTKYLAGEDGGTFAVGTTPGNGDVLKVVISGGAGEPYVFDCYVNDELLLTSPDNGFGTGYMGYVETGSGDVDGFTFNGGAGGGGGGGSAPSAPFTVTVHVDLVPTAGLTVTLMDLANSHIVDSGNLPVITNSVGQASFMSPYGQRTLQVVYLGDVYRFQIYVGPGPNRVNISTPPIDRQLPVTYLTKVTVQDAADNSAIANAAVYWGKMVTRPDSYLPIRTEDTVMARTDSSGVAYISTNLEQAIGYCIATKTGYSPRIINMLILAGDFVIKLGAKPDVDGDGRHALVVCVSNGAPVIREPDAAVLSTPEIQILIQRRYPYTPVGTGQQARGAVEYVGGFQTFGDMIFWLTIPGDDSTVISGPVQGNDFNCAVLHCQPSTDYKLWMGSPFLVLDPSPAELTTSAGRVSVRHVPFTSK